MTCSKQEWVKKIENEVAKKTPQISGNPLNKERQN
jgi:hypothetical protein